MICILSPPMERFGKLLFASSSLTSLSRLDAREMSESTLWHLTTEPESSINVSDDKDWNGGTKPDVGRGDFQSVTVLSKVQSFLDSFLLQFKKFKDDFTGAASFSGIIVDYS